MIEAEQCHVSSGMALRQRDGRKRRSTYPGQMGGNRRSSGAEAVTIGSYLETATWTFKMLSDADAQ